MLARPRRRPRWACGWSVPLICLKTRPKASWTSKSSRGNSEILVKPSAEEILSLRAASPSAATEWTPPSHGTDRELLDSCAEVYPVRRSVVGQSARIVSRVNIKPGGAVVWQGSYTFTVSQWGVGHGGFHSQSIFFQPLTRDPKTEPAGPGTMVRVIYDCGSGTRSKPTRKLNHGVKRMLEGVPQGSVIDLLVISHFDHDHVNGLIHLISELGIKQIRVEKVWAPVLTKIEALFGITAAINSGVEGTELQEYATLVANPIGRLRELFGNEDVVEILAPDEEPIPLSPSGGGLEDEGEIILTPAPNGRGIVATSGHGPTSEVLWEIRPYVTKSTLNQAVALSGTLSGCFGKPADEWTVDEMIQFATHEKHKACREGFHRAVRKNERPKIPERHRSTGANLSSICLYSGPVSPYDWCRFRGGWLPVTETPEAIPIAPAWLGTGDAALMEQQHVMNMSGLLTQSRLDRVGISSAPHHGSEFDSGADLWDVLPGVRIVTIEANHQAAGPDRRSHPHQGVLNELDTRNLDPFFCIDGKDFHRITKGYR